MNPYPDLRGRYSLKNLQHPYGPPLYKTLSVLSGVGGSVDREARLSMICDRVLRGGRRTDHRMNELRVWWVLFRVADYSKGTGCWYK